MIKIHFLIWPLLFVFTPLAMGLEKTKETHIAELVEQIEQTKLYEDKQWNKLLHYVKRWPWSKPTGQADGRGFYHAQDGHENSQSELIATLRAMFKHDENKFDKLNGRNDHAQCRFPARLQFLKNKLSIETEYLPKPKCKALDDFVLRHQAQSASLVFSSYHLDSPASAFGHTLLRLNKGDRYSTGKIHELLDMGVNYAAKVTTSNAFVYAVMGVFGFFHGEFASMPYFYKIREYNDFESRDLWAYDLNMTQSELKMLVHHFWEMGNTHFDYFYLTENCSYHMLTILEAVNPDWELVSQLPFYIIPVDTVKAVYNVPGLVKSITYRPSIRTKYNHRYDQLTPLQRDQLQRLVNNREQIHLPTQLNDQDKVNVVDTAIDYIDYKFSDDILREKGDVSLWKGKLLASRSKIPMGHSFKPLETPKQQMPHLGHPSHRAGLGLGHSDDHGIFQTVSMRFSLHDLLDPRLGQPEYAQIELFKARLRYNEEGNRVWLDDLALAEVFNLTPWDKGMKGMSINAKLGGITIRDDSCDQCFAPHAQVGGGIATNFKLGIPLLTYALAETQVSINSRLHRSWTRLAFGPHVGVRLDWSDKITSMLSGKYLHIPTSSDRSFNQTGLENRYHFNQRFSIKHLSVSLDGNWEHSLGLHAYF